MRVHDPYSRKHYFNVLVQYLRRHGLMTTYQLQSKPIAMMYVPLTDATKSVF